MCTENMYDIVEDLTVTIHESNQLYDPKPSWTLVNLFTQSEASKYRVL